MPFIEANAPPGRSDNSTSTGLISENQTSLGFNRLMDAYNPDRQFAHISTLASDSFQGRKTGSAGSAAAADYIESEFTRLGLEPWTAVGLDTFRQPFTASGLSGENIIAVIPGTDTDGAYLLLGAHYDHLGVNTTGEVFNGADDNAAGVAAVLEAARIFKQTGLTTDRTLVFCAFDAEEEGQIGSQSLGQMITDAGLATKTEMINIDGIGATGGGYFGVWDEGAETATPLVHALIQAGQLLGIKVVEEGTDIGSDAQPFNWQFHIPAVTVDWDWGSDPSVWHPYYHTVDDDAGMIDRQALSNATRVALAGFWVRACSPGS